MTDIDKFHEWGESQSPLALREYMFAQAAWQARGERIKELEAELAEWKEVGLGHDENARQAIKQLAELTAKNTDLEEKYQRQYKQWISLRELYNKTIREYDQPEIRLLKAKLHDSKEKNNGLYI